MNDPKLCDTLAEFAQRCGWDAPTLRKILTEQVERFTPDGWVALECQMLDSSRCGEVVILPYGGTATLRTIPQGPVSPRGLASDMSTVTAILFAGAVTV